MPISDIDFTQEKGNPSEKISKLGSKLGELTIETFFVDQAEKPIVTRDYIEMILSQYAQHTQDATLYNKWLQIDTKFDKSMREYKSDILILLTGLQSMNQAQQTMEQPIENNPAGPSVQTPPPPDVGGQRQELPTNKGI